MSTWLPWVALAALVLLMADGPGADLPDNSGAFSRLVPSELQFGCWGQSDDRENRLAQQLAEGQPAARVAAARALWAGHSRRHARDVLKLVAGDPPPVDTFPALKRDV